MVIQHDFDLPVELLDERYTSRIASGKMADLQLKKSQREKGREEGQLDSLADAVSFGAAPAFLALQVFKFDGPQTVVMLSRLIWAAGAL